MILQIDTSVYYYILIILIILSLIGFRSMYKIITDTAENDAHVFSLVFLGIMTPIILTFYLFNADYSTKISNIYYSDDVITNKIITTFIDKDSLIFNKEEKISIRDLNNKFKYTITSKQNIEAIKSNNFYIEEKEYYNIFNFLDETYYNLIYTTTNKNQPIKINKL